MKISDFNLNWNTILIAYVTEDLTLEYLHVPYSFPRRLKRKRRNRKLRNKQMLCRYVRIYHTAAAVHICRICYTLDMKAIVYCIA